MIRGKARKYPSFGNREGAIVAINASSSTKESPVVLPEPQHLHGHHRLIPKETNAGTAGALGKVGRTPRVLDDQSLQSEDPQGIKASLTLPEQVQLLCVWLHRCWLQCLRHVLRAHPLCSTRGWISPKWLPKGTCGLWTINLEDSRRHIHVTILSLSIRTTPMTQCWLPRCCQELSRATWPVSM